MRQKNLANTMKPVQVFDISVICQLVELGGKPMLDLTDQLKARYDVVFLARKVSGDKFAFVLAFSKELSKQYSAKLWLNQLLSPIAGRGGGRADLAQAGASGILTDDVVSLMQKAPTVISHFLSENS